MKTIIVMTSLAIFHPNLDAPASDVDRRSHVAASSFSEAPETLREPWSPPADVAEDESGYSIILELPGLARDDFDVSVQDGWIRVTGERLMPEETNGRLFNRIERRIGVFNRKFRVPADADESTVAAEYRDGLLTVNVAKDSERLARKVEIAFS